MTFEELKKVNAKLNTIDVKGKDYVEVNQRVLAFRELYPNGTIDTELISNTDGVCVMKARVFDGEKLLASGLAYEKESSSFINKTSFIENCETSAVGRALGFLGIGIGTSIASAEEVQNAIKNQEVKEVAKVTAMMVKTIKNELERTGVSGKSLAKAYKVDSIEDLNVKDYQDAMNKLKAKPDKESNES